MTGDFEIHWSQSDALRLARRLVEGGMPVFLGHPDPHAPTGYRLPYGWERAEADPGVVDAWRPGMALCAVTGVLWDVVDVDPRSGGRWDGTWMPEPYYVVNTPSAGQHYYVAPLGVGSRDGVLPGVDVKSGRPDGSGRGFVFLPPTVRSSKVVPREARPYEWAWQRQPGPRDTEDVSGAALRERIELLRSREPDRDQPRRLTRQQAAREWSSVTERLPQDLARWARSGWGGEAHAGLLAHSTHLARLSPENAERAWLNAFRVADLEPDDADMLKIRTAIDRAVPDQIVDPEQAGLSAQEAFWLGGGDAPPPDQGHQPAASVLVQPGHMPGQPLSADAFGFLTAERRAARKETEPTRYGAFGGQFGLFYSEGVHWLQGESESGKSWVGLGAVVDVVRQGGLALVLDYEDTEDRVTERLEQLGATDDELGRICYVSGFDVTHDAVVAHIVTGGRDYSLVLVDGVTTALNLAGLKANDNQDVTAWVDALPRRVRCSIMIDHVTKDPENRNGNAIGAGAKKAVVTGSSYEVIAREKFGRGGSGVIELRLQKDKPGWLRGQRGAGTTRLVFASDGLTGSVHIGVAASAPLDPARRAALDSERGAEVMAVASKLEAYPQVHSGHSLRHLVGVLKNELGVTGRDNTLRDAVRLFKHRAGVPGVDLPDWLAQYLGQIANVIPIRPDTEMEM